MNKIYSYLIALYIFFSMNPYYIWGNIYLLVPFLVILLVFKFYLFGQIKLDKLVASMIVFILTSYVLFLNKASFGWMLVMSLSVSLVYLLSLKDVEMVYKKFKIIFLLSLFPSIIYWILHLFGFNAMMFSLGTINDNDVPNQLKVLAGMHYVKLPGAVILDYMTKLPIYRNGGIFDEPGFLGTVSAFILMAERYNLKNKQNLFIFFIGVSSLSFAFLLLTMLYFILSIKKSFKYILVMIVTFTILLEFYPNSPLNEFTIERLTMFIDGNKLSDNRDIHLSKNWEDWKSSDIKGIFFGNIQTDEGSSWKSLLIRSGLTGVFALFIIYFFIFKKINYKQLGYYEYIFILLFILSLYQRQDILNPYMLLIFMVGLNSKYFILKEKT
jgi:hypothetical protein